MKRSPITRQRSSWEPFEHTTAITPGDWYERRVGDGTLTACVAEEPHGWHMSISFRDHKDRPARYPRWDEIADARDNLLPDDIEFVMFLPRSEEYLAVHDTCFHLHEYPERVQ